MLCICLSIILICLRCVLSETFQVQTRRMYNDNELNIYNLTNNNVSRSVFNDDPYEIQITGNTKSIKNRIIFHGFSNLVQINIFNNSELDAIPKFVQLKKLSDVEMTGNNFENLPNDTFVMSNSVISLRLGNNKISNIETNFFGPNLYYVYLECNKLKYFNKEWFQNPSSVLYLSLSGNFIETIKEKSFSNFSSLVHLYLELNNIFEIENNAFPNKDYFYYIDLSYNNLTKLPSNFSASKNVIIYELKLGYNNLSFVPKNWLNSIRFNYLNPTIDGNPWQCTCLINNITKWMTAADLPEHEDPDTCFEIPGYNDKYCKEEVNHDIIKIYASMRSPPKRTREKFCVV